ncbi:hypothetical protein [Bradyrhizobium sp.]
MAKTGSWVYRNGELVEKHLAAPLPRGQASDLPMPMVISDIDPYRAAAADKASGKRPVIGGRRQHREFLRNNGYREVGNDVPKVERSTLTQKDRVADIKRAIGD